MSLPVNLRAVMDEMDMAADEMTAYINCKTGELITLTDEDFSYAEDDDTNALIPDWQKELVEKAKMILADDDYIELPGRFEINDYSIMERFCYSVEDERVQNALLQAIKGKGAFRYFKDRIHEEGLHDDWFAFRDNALKQIAADFLKIHEIPHSDE